MSEPKKTKVLIVAKQPEEAARWADMLPDAEFEVWLEPNEMPEPDVVVTNDDTLETEEHAAVVWIDCFATRAPNPAHIGYFGDPPPGHLRLVCRLLTSVSFALRLFAESLVKCRRLEAEALTDPLTELPNRRAWDRTLGQRLAENPRPKRLCVAMLDLDLFKRVNDSAGHAVGDDVLRVAATTINGHLGSRDFAARLGGDEFGVIFWVLDEDDAGGWVEKFRHVSSPDGCAVTASAGFRVIGPDESLSSEEVFQSVALALRDAKQQGRDRAVEA